MEDFRIDGFPLGKLLAPRYSDYQRRRENYGSIITVIATDLPLVPSQINRLCKRSALGIGRVGSYASHGSDEIILGFSTANAFKLGRETSSTKFQFINDDCLSSSYKAVIEATEEAIVNSLTQSESMVGNENNCVPSISVELIQKAMNQYRKVKI